MPGRRGRVVVGEGGVLLLVLLDRPYFEASLGQPAEVARRRRHRAVDVLASPRDERFLALGRVARGCLERDTIGADVVAESRGARDRAALIVDRGEGFEADAVDLLGIHLERRPAADRGAVDRVTVRGRPDARLLPAGMAVFATQRLEEGGV